MDTVIHDYKRFGTSLRAACDFGLGEVVLRDSPIAEWVVEHPRDPRINDAMLRHGIPLFMAAAASLYLTSDSDIRQRIKDMYVPSLPITLGTKALYDFCDELSKTHDVSGVDLAYAIVACKVNAHRAPSGSWRLYGVASRLAHACDPCVLYLPQTSTFIARRPIAAGTLLTMSYLGGDVLQRASMRQERLLGSHLFLCRCERCEGTEKLRGLPCPTCRDGIVRRVASPLLASDGDLWPKSPWVCEACGAEKNDADLSGLFEKEAQYERQLTQIFLKPLSFTSMSAMIKDMGSGWESHWVTASLYQALATYFHAIARRGCAIAEDFSLAWGLQFLSLLERAGEMKEELHHPREFPPLVAATMVAMCAETSHRCRQWRVTGAMRRWVHPMASAMYGADDPRTAALLPPFDPNPPKNTDKHNAEETTETVERHAHTTDHNEATETKDTKDTVETDTKDMTDTTESAVEALPAMPSAPPTAPTTPSTAAAEVPTEVPAAPSGVLVRCSDCLARMSAAFQTPMSLIAEWEGMLRVGETGR